jgi:hypothetical protein
VLDALPGANLNFHYKNLKHYKVMKKEGINTNIEIEGVIITDKALKMLGNLQARDNDGLELYRDLLANAVCLIGSLMLTIDEDRVKKSAETIIFLSSLRDEIIDLRKP